MFAFIVLIFLKMFSTSKKGINGRLISILYPTSFYYDS